MLHALPILRELGVASAVNLPCASDHDVSHGVIVNTLNHQQTPRPLYKLGAWLKSTALGPAIGLQPDQAHDTRLGETLDAIYPHHLTIWQTIIQTTVQRYRFAQRGNSARHLLDIELSSDDGALTLKHQVNAEKLAQAQARDGRYLLATNRWDLHGPNTGTNERAGCCRETLPQSQRLNDLSLPLPQQTLMLA